MSSKKKQAVQLEFGIRDGKVISIHDLSSQEKGNQCNCICPGCKEKLIARLGAKNRWHFAHENDKDNQCNITAAQQTALHMLAKEIIEENKKLLFPGITITRDNYVDSDLDYRVVTRIPYTFDFKESRVVNCDSVLLENKISNIVPDIIITAQGHPCLVEIAVTHFVDEEKEKKIKALGLPLLEIDLSSFYKQDYSGEDLIKEVLHNPDNRKWIYNPLYDEAKKCAKYEYAKYLNAAIKEVEQEDRLLAEKTRKRENAKKKIREIFEPINYKNAVLSLENEKEAKRIVGQLRMKTSFDVLPFFLNIPISGEMIFPCDRRIWQSAIFERFVYNRNTDNDLPPTINIKKVQSWITDHQNYFKVDWNLVYKTSVSIDSRDKVVLLFYDVIFTFLNYLVYLGFLDNYPFHEYAVKKSYSLTPPNTEHADILLNALRKVDWCTPSVDIQILDMIAQNYNSSDNKAYIENCSN